MRILIKLIYYFIEINSHVIFSIVKKLHLVKDECHILHCTCETHNGPENFSH